MSVVLSEMHPKVDDGSVGGGGVERQTDVRSSQELKSQLQNRSAGHTGVHSKALSPLLCV